MKTASTTSSASSSSTSLWGRRRRIIGYNANHQNNNHNNNNINRGGGEGTTIEDKKNNDDDEENNNSSKNNNNEYNDEMNDTYGGGGGDGDVLDGSNDDVDTNNNNDYESSRNDDEHRHGTAANHGESSEHQEEYNTMIYLTMELVYTLVTIRSGDPVMTPYGRGTLLERKNRNGSMVIDIGYGTLYFRQPEMIHKIFNQDEYQQAMDHLEVVRKLQLAGQCEQWNVPLTDGVCVGCLFDKPETKRYVDNASRRNGGSRWRVRRTSSSNSTSKKNKKASQVCDVCGNPVCANHKIATGGGGGSGGGTSSSSSDAEHFCMCVDCSFDLTQIKVQLDPNHPQLRQNLDRLLHYYTRMVLQVSFVIPTLRDVAANLTTKDRRNSHIKLGTGGLSFVGAALGVAGAAALLTPVGHVILLAAAATSASSAAIQGTHAGYNMMLSSREANLVADRALGWHGLCLGILDSLEQLRRDLLAEHIKSGYDDADLLEQLSGRNNNTSKKSQALEVWNTLAVGGFHTTRHGLTGVGLTAQLGASYSQAISASIQTVPVVGAAFSVGCMAMDASNIASTLQSLQKPTAKATALHELEKSFTTHIPATIHYEVEALMRAINDLRERHEEVRRNQETDLIEQELEELNFM